MATADAAIAAVLEDAQRSVATHDRCITQLHQLLKTKKGAASRALAAAPAGLPACRSPAPCPGAFTTALLGFVDRLLVRAHLPHRSLKRPARPPARARRWCTSASPRWSAWSSSWRAWRPRSAMTATPATSSSPCRSSGARRPRRLCCDALQPR
jgi:hypothetical protein